MNADNLVIESDEQKMLKDKKKPKKEIKKLTEQEEQEFARDYKRMGGIQHIICSATMTIDNTGRITPK